LQWALSNIEVVCCWLILLAVWVWSVFVISRSATYSQTIRRAIFCFLGLLGLGLLITRPSLLVNADRSTVYLYTSDDKNSADIDDRRSRVSFKNVYDFLNSKEAKYTDTVHIIGRGLVLEEVGLLGDYNIEFHADELQSGITRIEMPVITEGEDWTLTGDLQGEDIDGIYLNTPTGNRSDATLTDSTFALISEAPPAGDYLLNIHVLLQTGDTIKDVLPIMVKHEPTWELLVLSSYPSFEMNYLKNFWTAQGNGFAMRQQISADRFQSAFVNTKTRNIERITSRLVKSMDFIIVDMSSWNQLSDLERTTVLRAVRNDGLALIFRPTSESIVATGVRLPNMSDSREEQWSFPSGEIPLIHFPTSDTWSAVRDNNLVTARFRSMGLGHLMTLTIEDTYKLVLGDQEAGYQDLWSQIFSNLYRDFFPRAQLNNQNWIWEKEPTDLQLLTPFQLTTKPILNDSLSLPFLSVPFVSGVSEVTIVPKAGYQTIDLGDQSSPLQFYVHGERTWSAMRQAQLRRINKEAASSSNYNKDKLSFKTAEEITFYWWYGLVLLGFGGLWLDERLRPQK